MKKKLKKMMENIMYCLFSTKVEQVYKKIEKYDYISFDIFDTLIKRNTNIPEDIFDIMEQSSGIKNFRLKRINAQEKALSNTKREEITLEEIYQNFDFLSEKEINFLIKLEIETEKKICNQNKEIFNLYQKCLKNNKKIYIISDMYLPICTIEEILFQNNYTNYEKIFLSSELMHTKKSGKIFNFVLSYNNNIKNNIIHIGDHPLSDYIMPRIKGIKSILIRK